MIKLVASDIDGTLLRKAGPLDEKYITLIQQLLDHGVRFAAVGGRQYTSLRRMFAPVSEKIDYVCENGSLVISQGEICLKRVVDRDMGQRVLRVLQAVSGCEVLLSGVHTSYIQPKTPDYEPFLRTVLGNDVTVVPDLSAVPEDIVKISGYFKKGVPPKLVDVFAKKTLPKMRPVITGPLWLDFFLEGCNKGTGLAALQQTLGITKEETLCFGDDENDIELLDQAGTPCAVMQCSPQLRPHAQCLVSSVADFLDGFITGLL